MKLIWDNGLIIESETRRVILDPQIKHVRSDLTLISHAHIDHIQGLNPEHTLISSKETYEILKARVACSSKKHIQLNRRQLYEDTDFKITPYNSGHVLGSFQYFIESEEGSILYSSDINCVRSLTTPEAESVEAETLILESTYGRPEYALPPREEIYVEIVEWCLRTLSEGKIPVFKAYSLGKSQELIKLVNNYLQIPVIVDPYIAAISEVYDKSGVRLKFLTQGEEEAERFLNQKSGILIVSSFKSLEPFFERKDLEIAYASGWALKYKPRSCSAAFPLSSHADYYQLLNFVEACSPKKVYTCHGFAADLAKAIEVKLGIRAQPLQDIFQKTLLDF